MQVSYKGFALEVHREEALGSGSATRFVAMRERDGFYLVDDCSEAAGPEEMWLSHLQQRVDEHLDAERQRELRERAVIEVELRERGRRQCEGR